METKQPIPGKESLKDEAARALRGRILSGELVPGEFLNRRGMAMELGMSVAPVLEAMLLLETEGLLETIARKGTRVRIHRPEDMRGQFLVREALECQVAREVFGPPVAADFRRLADLARRVDACRREQSMDVWEAEVDFHCALAELLGCPLFTHVYRQAVRADLFFKLRYPPASHASRRSHVSLLKALRDAPDATSAEALCRGDLRQGRAAHFLPETDHRNPPLQHP